MGTQQTQSYCVRCKKYTLHTRSPVDVPHIFHLLMTVFLCGLWFPVWILHIIITALAEEEPYRCTQCGQADGETEADRKAVLAAQRRVKADRDAGAFSEIIAHAQARLIGFGAFCMGVASVTGRGIRRVIKWADGRLYAASGDDAFFHGFLRCLTVVLIAVGVGIALWLVLG